MKLNGNAIRPPEPLVIAIPREGEDVIFRAGAVVDFTEFEKLCPEPRAPILTKAGETVGVPDLKDKDYLKEVAKHNTLHFNWLILKSLAATDGLTWDTVNLQDPTTWVNVFVEMEKSGITRTERNYITSKVIEANNLTDKHFEEARQRFLLRREAQSKS